jgi:hypothetical protein
MVELHKNIRIAKKGDGKGIINFFNEGLKRDSANIPVLIN